MEYSQIRASADIIKYSREKHCLLLSEDRMKEHKTNLFKTFIKKPNVIYFKLREFESIANRFTGKCFFRLCQMTPDGATVIINSFIEKAKLIIAFNKLK